MASFPCPHCQQLIEVHARNAGQPVLMSPPAAPGEIVADLCRAHGVTEADIVRPGRLSLPHQLIRYVIIRELARRFPNAGDVAIARWLRVDRSTVWAVLHDKGVAA